MEALARSRARSVRPSGVDLAPFLPHALAATLAVFGLPAAVVLGLILTMDSPPPIVLMSGLSLGLSTGFSMLGAHLWLRHPASSEVSFGDLMVWGWLRRKRAEASLDRGTRLLGLDRGGLPTDGLPITREHQIKVLHELNTALESKDPYTRGHAERVERHVYRTAAAMGLSVHDLQELRMAAALHDIGKIRVPDKIIRKPGKLTPQERATMEEHSVVGAWMLSHVASTDVIEAVRYHHERWDGAGYPDGLSGADIPLYARIIAVADTFDAITSTRPYRAKAERARAIEVLREENGKQFDPLVVDAFLTALPQRIPVMALFFVPGAGRVLREMAVSLRRAGAASLAGATTAASATVMIGAATIVPAFDATPTRAPAPVVGPASPGAAEDETAAGVPLGPPGPDADGATARGDDERMRRGLATIGRSGSGRRTTSLDEILPDDADGAMASEVGSANAGGSATADAVRQNDNEGGAGKSGSAPGRSGERGKSDDKGKSGAAPGRSGDNPGNGGNRPGRPDNPGNGGGRPDDPGNGGGRPEDPGNGGGRPENPGNGGGRPENPGNGGGPPSNPGGGNSGNGGPPSNPGS